MEAFELIAQPRTELGKNANRRLRREGLVPAVIYGAGKEPKWLTLYHKDLMKQLQNEGFYSHILTVNIENQRERAVLKDLQRHPWRPLVLHVDLQRINETEMLYMHVPLHFINEDKCIGVKQGGGVISHHMVEVEVRCLPKDLPEFISVDLTDLNINDILHLSDLVLPEGVEIVSLIQAGAEHDLSVVSVHSVHGHTEGEGPEGTQPQ